MLPNLSVNEINKSQYFWRLALITLPLLALLVFFNKASLFIVLAFLLIALIFIFLKDYLWVLLVFAIPSLALGEFIYIPVTINWVYEARLTEIFLILAAAVFLLDKYLSGRLHELKGDRIVFLLFVYAFIAISLAGQVLDTRLYVTGMKVVIYSFLSYFLALNLLNTKMKIRIFLYGVCAGAFILSAQLFWKFYNMGFSTKFFFERNTILIPLGPIATASAILAFLAVVIFAFYFSEKEKDIKPYPFLFLIFLATSMAVFLTLGKGAIGSMLLGLGLIFLKIKPSRLVLFLFVLWLAVMGYFFLNPFLAGLWERLNSMFVDVNTKFRILEYKTAIKVIADHVWLGVGPGQQLYYFKHLLNLDTAQLVNNFFLQAMIDLGVFGFTLAMFLVLAFASKISQMKKALAGRSFLLAGFSAALVAAFANGLVEVTFYALPYAMAFWLVIGVLPNLKIYEQIERSDNQL